MSLLLPNPPRSGEPVRADHLARLIDYCRSITPRSSAFCRVSTTAGGTTFQPVARPGPESPPGGEGIDLSVFAFGCSVNGDVVNVNNGSVIHATHPPASVLYVSGVSRHLMADHQYMWVEYNLTGHTVAIAGPSTVEPQPDAQTFRVWLAKFRLVDGVGSFEQIGHVGNILIPSVYE